VSHSFNKQIIVSAALLLSGCATISVPEKPERTAFVQTEAIATPQFFNSEGTSLPMASQWWSLFGDNTLTALVEQTLIANRELDVAEANINIASASLARQALENSYSTQSSSKPKHNIGQL